MKLLTFPGYDRTEKDDLGRPAVQARAWYIAFLAISQAPSGPTAERSNQVNKLYNAFRKLLQSEGTGQQTERFLRPEGGEFALEDAELRLFKEIIEEFRKNVTGAGADALVYLDTLVASAPEVPKIVH